MAKLFTLSRDYKQFLWLTLIYHDKGRYEFAKDMGKHRGKNTLYISIKFQGKSPQSQGTRK
jgi:hypothetical protein